MLHYLLLPLRQLNPKLTKVPRRFVTWLVWLIIWLNRTVANTMSKAMAIAIAIATVVSTPLAPSSLHEAAKSDIFSITVSVICRECCSHIFLFLFHDLLLIFISHIFLFLHCDLLLISLGLIIFWNYLSCTRTAYFVPIWRRERNHAGFDDGFSDLISLGLIIHWTRIQYEHLELILLLKKFTEQVNWVLYLPSSFRLSQEPFVEVFLNFTIYIIYIHNFAA